MRSAPRPWGSGGRLQAKSSRPGADEGGSTAEQWQSRTRSARSGGEISPSFSWPSGQARSAGMRPPLNWRVGGIAKPWRGWASPSPSVSADSAASWASGSMSTSAPPRLCSTARSRTTLAKFEQRLRNVVAALDDRHRAGTELETEGVAAVTEAAGWTHAEWVCIHPSVNDNGCTARLWAIDLMLRSGLPPVVRLRPRHDRGYAAAGARAMTGDREPMAQLIRRLLRNLPPATRQGANRSRVRPWAKRVVAANIWQPSPPPRPRTPTCVFRAGVSLDRL